MIIDLIRHTTPDVPSGTCYGQSDLTLESSYPDEFEKIYKKIAPHGQEEPYDLLITSPLKRCKQLADTLNAKHRRTDERIKEYDFGDWELLPWSEIKGKQSETWMKNFVDQPAPNGESMLIMQQRVMHFWQELIEELADTTQSSNVQKPPKSIAIVSHSGVQRLLHADILKTPLEYMFRLQLDFGAVIRLKHDVKNELTTIHHL